MYSTLLQLRTHVETEKLERTTLKQLVQRLQIDFALLQPQIESLDRPPTSKSPLVTLGNKIRILGSVYLLKRADTIRGSILYNINSQPWAIKSASSNTANLPSFCGKLHQSYLYLSLLDYGI